MFGPICINDKIICRDNHGRICVEIPGFKIIGNRYGNYNYAWHFLTVELPNGTYEIEFLTGAINPGGGSSLWYGGNCIWYDGIKETILGLDLPDGWSYLPGSNDTYPSSRAAEMDNVGKKSVIEITQGGISVCFKDTNITDNRGFIIYGYNKLEA